MTLLKTALILFIFINILNKAKSEEDRPQKYGMTVADEPLLRSSEERDIPDDIDPYGDIDHQGDTTDPHKAETTDEPTTLSLDTDVNEELDDDNRRVDYADVSSTTGVPDETTTDEVVIEAEGEDVDEEDGVDASGNVSISKALQPEPSTTQAVIVATPAEPELVAPRASRFDDQEYAQRSLNTDDSEPHQPHFASNSATLRDWLQDPWLRAPPGILVPLRPEALSRALAVWRDLIDDEELNLPDVVVIGYDGNGINWRSRHNLMGTTPGGDRRAVTEVLAKLLRKYQDVNTLAGDGTMRALTAATKLVPYDSALFVITDKGPNDVQRLPLALRALVEKRLKVYTIWTHPEPPPPQSPALRELRNLSAHTEGEVLPYSLQTMDMESEMRSDMNLDVLDLHQGRMAKQNSLLDEKLETLLVKRGGGGAIFLGVPVETGVSALKIYIEGAVEHAVLYPPNDAPQIDLYNQTSVELFSPGSRTETKSPRDVFLKFPGAPDDNMLAVLPMTSASSDGSSPNAGVWHLSMRCATCDYRLTVSARARLRFRANVIGDNMIRLRVLGPVSTVRESMLVDEYETELGKLTFNYQPAAGEASDGRLGDNDQELMADVPLPDVKAAKVYAKIIGRDVNGESFTRLSGPLALTPEPRTGRSAIAFPPELELAEEYQQMRDTRLLYNDSNVLPSGRASSQVINQMGTLMTAVQVGLSSRIYGAPGDNLQLHFEVTNYREQAVYFRFEAVGELRFLRGIAPTAMNIQAGQTAQVIVSIGITVGTQPGARDLITFTAYGSNIEQVSISSYVYVINRDAPISDVWQPQIRHDFQGSCIGRQGADCSQHVWSTTVFASDAGSGILRLSSTPVGLMYTSNFIAGARGEVSATYRATCCAPRVIVTAVDALGNANSYVVDISNYFTPAAISAIVFGVLFIIALIAIIVFLIYWCVRRRKESRELPYTASSRREIS